MSKPKDKVSPKGKVIVLHGLESNALVMLPMARRLAKDGWEVHNSTYKCGRRTWQEIAEDLREYINSVVTNDERVSFVCHSLSGILLRHCIKQGLDCYINKVVTIAAPHQGAYWVNEIPFGREIGYTLFGKALVDSLMDVESIRKLPNLTPYRVLCITTNKPVSITNPLSWLAGKRIKGENDGFVGLKGQTLVGSETVNFHLDHLWAVKDKKLTSCILNYLNYGGL